MILPHRYTLLHYLTPSQFWKPHGRHLLVREQCLRSNAHILKYGTENGVI